VLASARTTEEERNRPIIFVGHSLGGILCKDGLQVSMNNAEPHLQAIVAITCAVIGTEPGQLDKTWTARMVCYGSGESQALANPR
jgi:alpha-beta hydrolase superfamily lysophospholipase